MVTLTEALAAERARRQQEAADTATRQMVGRTVLEALEQKLNAEPVPGWAFFLEGQQLRIARTTEGARHQVGAWTVDENMRLVCGEQMTGWITSESYARVIDEAVGITAQLIVGTEVVGAARSNERTAGPTAEIVELPPRF